MQNHVLILHTSGKLKCFDLDTGLYLWEQGPFHEAILLGAGEHMMLLKSGFKLMGLNAKDGKVKWTSQLHYPEIAWSQLNFKSFALLVENTLYHLNLFDGAIVELGQIKLPLRANTPFSFDGKRYLAIAQESGAVCLYDLKKAKIKWQFKSGAKVTQSPVLKGKMLYILSEDHFIYALKLKNGHQKFRKKMANKLRYPAAKSDEFLLLSPFNSRNLYMVEMSTGSSQNLFSLDSDRYHFVSSPFFRGNSLAAIYADYFSDSSFLIVFSVGIKR